MPLLTVHRIFIVTAILLALFYGGWELYGFTQDGRRGALLSGAVSIIIAIALVRYYPTIGVRKDRRAGDDRGDARTP
jgi:hypothetical protein